MTYNNFEKRYFLFRDQWDITIYEFDSNTKPVFCIDYEGEYIINETADNHQDIDSHFLKNKFPETGVLIEVNTDLERVLGKEKPLIYEDGDFAPEFQ